MQTVHVTHQAALSNGVAHIGPGRLARLSRYQLHEHKMAERMPTMSTEWTK